jgi:hypothetical protein
MGAFSKAKGGKFERLVCKALSLWVTRGKSGDCFWRSAMSGGRATVHGTNVRQGGDIACVASEGHVFTDLFIAECKHERNLDLFAFVLLRRGRLWRYWQKLSKLALARNKHAMLIAKQNRVPTIVVTDSPHSASKSVTIEGSEGSAVCYMMLFDDMVKEPFKARVNSRRKTRPKAEPLTILETDE